MVQPIFHFVRGFTKGVTNRGDSGTGWLGEGEIGGKDDSRGEMAGVLQQFTRGPVHEHVNVEPGGVPVVTVPNVRHVCEFVYTLTCARARYICVYVYTKRGGARTLESAQVECQDTLYLTLNTRH